MYACCSRTNLGPRARNSALRAGVAFGGFALLFALVVLEIHAPAELGWLLVVPVAASVYSVLSGTFGICVYHGLKGNRGTDHGSEVVLDEASKSRLLLRAALAVSVSLATGCVLAAVFVSSV
jgi:hypothetical protein